MSDYAFQGAADAAAVALRGGTLPLLREPATTDDNNFVRQVAVQAVAQIVA